MTAKDAIKTALISTQNLLTWYVSDLADADLLVRPTPGANHSAWQLGHLIFAEPYLIGLLGIAASYPALPEGYAQRYGKEGAAYDGPAGFATKAEYVDLFQRTRQATLAALADLPEADLDKPTPGKMGQFAPTFAAMFLLVSNHTLMHGGQITVVRRKLGKPVLF